MLNSDNDAAVMIAEQVGGSVEGFTEKMNLKAREIGCEDTYFITPNGLDAENENGIHSTTAEDLARILRYCIMESPKKDGRSADGENRIYGECRVLLCGSLTVGRKNTDRVSACVRMAE